MFLKALTDEGRVVMVKEKGVLRGSSIFYNTPSVIARSAFFHITLAGNFICDASYRVERGSYYNFLLMHVHAGSGVVRFGGRDLKVGVNSVVLIDCTRSHTYFTETGWEIGWIHFDGSASHSIYNLIVEQFGNVVVLDDGKVVPHYLSLILSAFGQGRPLPEALVSSYVHRMLSEVILVAQGQTLRDGQVDVIEDAISYIHANFAETLTVTQLAAYVHLSPFHFSRVFKLRTGYGPYEYVLKTRIDRARHLLKNTSLNVGEIARKVGFKSEPNFVSTFRRITQQTPGRFRKTPL